jgi:hypothetical protein
MGAAISTLKAANDERRFAAAFRSIYESSITRPDGFPNPSFSSRVTLPSELTTMKYSVDSPRSGVQTGMHYFRKSVRLGFRSWRDEDLPLAMGLWGDPKVTALIGGPFTPEMVRERLTKEIRQ